MAFGQNNVDLSSFFAIRIGNHGEFYRYSKKWTYFLSLSMVPLYIRTANACHWIIGHLYERARARPNISDSLRKHICLRANTSRRAASCRSSLRHQSGTRNVSGAVFALQDNIPHLSKDIGRMRYYCARLLPSLRGIIFCLKRVRWSSSSGCVGFSDSEVTSNLLCNLNIWIIIRSRRVSFSSLPNVDPPLFH